MTEPAQPPPFWTADRLRAFIALAAIALMVIVPLMIVAYMRANPTQAKGDDPADFVSRKKSLRGSKTSADTPKPPAEASDKPMVSLVLLLRTPYAPGLTDVRTAAQKAFGERFGSSQNDENFVVSVGANGYAIGMHARRRTGAQLGVMMSPEPYDDDLEAFSAKCPNPALRPLIMQHKAWLAVDFFGDVDASNRPRVYKMIGQLLAQFAGNNCLVFYATETGQFRRYDARVPGMLSGGSPADDFVDHVPTR